MKIRKKSKKSLKLNAQARWQKYRIKGLFFPTNGKQYRKL